ncbi:MAG: metallophosphoesterase family protein [Acidimicrobiia bacterium]|nr:metallophosphoesterase family protein [Acidimicrobiia bacterium]
MPVPRLPAGTAACFVGDLHLGDGAGNDLFTDKDSTLVPYLESCPDRFDAVVFMGDVIDIPQGWSARRILAAHADVAAGIESLTAKLPVYFVRGNHDWRVDYPRLFPGATHCDEMHVGEVLVWHGHRLDRYCHPERRSYPAQVGLHHLAERLFGFEFRVPLHEHDTAQNRFVHWAGYHYARHLRRRAAAARARGDAETAADCEEFISYWSRAVWGDPHAYFEPVSAFLTDGPHEAVVCGHTHLAGIVGIGDRTYVNAGSWTFGACEVAELDGTAFSVVDVASGREIGDESYRWMCDGDDPGDYFAWWDSAYLGRLRFRNPRERVTP